MLHVLTWRWGKKYPSEYVDRLRNAVARNLTVPHRFIVAKPSPEDDYLTEIPGCFARLRTFDPDWQFDHGINEGDSILSLDLDLVVTGNLDAVATRPEPFAILQGVNAANPNPFNGSVWKLRAGYRPDVWSKFNVEAAGNVPFYAFPDDQAWFHHMMPDAGAVGPADGVYGFQKPGWPGGVDLPSGAVAVAFFGKRDPKQFVNLAWVKEHWR